MIATTRLVNPTTVTTSYSTIYTCPSGKTALLKFVASVNLNNASNVLRLTLNNNNTNDTIYLLSHAANQFVGQGGVFLVLLPGDTLRAVGSTGSFIVSVHGALLTGVA